jgi:hypothetical protein
MSKKFGVSEEGGVSEEWVRDSTARHVGLTAYESYMVSESE